MKQVLGDQYYMKQAIIEAQKAYDADEVPIGAVIVCNRQIIARAYNQTQLLNDVTAHAEILAITSASAFLQSKYLHDCTLYVTLEPCLMCAGALAWSQIGKIVYGAADEKGGFMKYGKEVLHPKTNLAYGELEEESRKLLQGFFQKKRMSLQ